MGFSSYRNIVVLTGAGISAESGIKTFRDQNGLWENHRIEDVATPEGFYKNRQLVNDFYNERRRSLISPQIRPNPAHIALANFENKWQGNFALVTQNVDDLHERAGSKNIYHMHGQLLQARCLNCGKIQTWLQDIETESICSSCQQKNSLRPNIVWFGELPFFMQEINQLLTTCDLFLSIGTSGHVYPAAMFVQTVRKYSAGHCVQFNTQATDNQDLFHETIIGPAGTTLAKYLEKFNFN